MKFCLIVVWINKFCTWKNRVLYTNDSVNTYLLSRNFYVFYIKLKRADYKTTLNLYVKILDLLTKGNHFIYEYMYSMILFWGIIFTIGNHLQMKMCKIFQKDNIKMLKLVIFG